MLIEFGIGFGLGIAVGIQMSKILWYENSESVWEKKIRENKIAEDAIEIYKNKESENHS